MNEQTIADLMLQQITGKKVHKKGGINSEYNEAVSQVFETITDQVDYKTKKKWTFSRWCGFLRGIPPYHILHMLNVAKKNKSVGRHFNWQVKEFKSKFK